MCRARAKPAGCEEGLKRKRKRAYCYCKQSPSPLVLEVWWRWCAATMVISCSAYGCTNRWNSKPDGIAFHRFPKRDDQRQLWEKATKRKNWTASPNHALCTVHFEDKWVLRSENRIRLKDGAIPTVFSGFPPHMTKQEKKCRLTVTSGRTTSCDYLLTSTASSESTPNKQIPASHSNSRTASSSTGTINSAETSTYAEDSPRKKQLKTIIFKKQKHINSLKKKFKALQQSRRRLQKKCTTFKQIIDELENKRIVSENCLDMLKKSVPREGEALLERLESSVNEKGFSKDQYSPELRCFALTLQYYSPAAYEYVRKTFKCCLPHQRTIRRWYSSIGGEPGFASEALKTLEAKAKHAKSAGKSTVVSLVVDEMSIRKHVEFDGKNVVGYVDMGTGLIDDTLPEANNVIVFMVVSLNDFWKFPCGYFLINSCSGSERAEMLRKCLTELNHIGVEVVSCTFDGTSSNLTMAEKLGAKLNVSNIDEMVPYFKHPDTGYPVNVILDPSHMLKLIRNCLADKKVLYDGKGNAIKWNYIEELQKLQDKEGLKIGTKLTTAHIQWQRQKMKVRLAAQVLSSSVADALQICEEELRLPQFQGAAATIKFLRVSDRLFDTLNSSSPICRTYKAPLRETNKSFWLPFLNEAKSYILGLRDSEGKDILKSQRKTGFLGFLVCIDNVIRLFNSLIVERKILRYLLTYKLSQDHIEMFFGCIRRQFGCNNNPSARQFKSAYKKLLVRNQVRCSGNGNVSSLSDITILHISTLPLTNKLRDTENVCLEPAMNLPADFSRLSLYVETVIPYIAGFVVLKLSKKLDCDVCVNALFANDENYTMIETKTNGGLISPSKDVVEICKVTEAFFRCAQKASNNFNVHFKTNSLLQAAKAATEKGVFNNLDEHCKSFGVFSGHIHELIKDIAKCYFNVRLHHATKVRNHIMTGKKVRSVLSRLVIFKNQ